MLVTVSTVITTSFSPLVHVAVPPFSTASSFTVMLTVAPSVVGVASIFPLAAAVSPAYSFVAEANSGVSVVDPIVRLDRVAVSFLLR